MQGKHDPDSFEQLSPVPDAERSSGRTDDRDAGRGSGQGKRTRANSQPSSSLKAGGGPSLKMRAVGLLSRREHSRAELARKLAPYADVDNPDELKQVLDALERENWQSDARFAQSLIHRRAPRKGTALVIQELRQHGLPDDQLTQIREQLRGTELERARTVWQHKFNRAPVDRADYAKQFRFLASRGFSSDCLRRILGEQDSDAMDE